MKNIAVIGPDQQLVESLARQLTGVRALPGAGPQENIDGVLAVAGQPSEEGLEILRAVASNVGCVVLAAEGSWPSIPGVHFSSFQDVPAIQRLIDQLYVDQQQWEADARQADQQRMEQARVAVRLNMQRFIRQASLEPRVAEEEAKGEGRAGAKRGGGKRSGAKGAGDTAEGPDAEWQAEEQEQGQAEVPSAGEAAGGAEPEGHGPERGLKGLHERFIAELRLAVLSQGILCPALDEELPSGARRVDVPGRTAQVAALIAGVFGVVGLFFAVGRVAGYPWLGLVLGLLAAATVGWFRVAAQQRAMAQAQREADLHALKEAWSSQVSEVLARIQVPRVAEQLNLPAGV